MELDLSLEVVKWTGQRKSFGITQICMQTDSTITSRDFSKDSASGSLRFLLCKMGMQVLREGLGCAWHIAGTQCMAVSLFFKFKLLIESNTILLLFQNC